MAVEAKGFAHPALEQIAFHGALEMTLRYGNHHSDAAAARTCTENSLQRMPEGYVTAFQDGLNVVPGAEYVFFWEGEVHLFAEVVVEGVGNRWESRCRRLNLHVQAFGFHSLGRVRPVSGEQEVLLLEIRIVLLE